MKWFVLILLCANVGLWLAAERVEVAGVTSGSGNRLPRVAQLQPVPEPGVAVDAVDAVVAEAAEIEPEPQGEAAAGMSARAQTYCITLGWFDELTDAASAADQLKIEYPGELDIKQVERPQAPLYWVLVPPAESYEAALEGLRAIRQQDIDSYLVTEGPRKNAISLGLFESKAAAESVLEQRNKKNLHATLVLFPRNQLSYALAFEVAYVPDSKEFGRVGADLSQQFELVQIKRCEGVATAEKTP